MREVREVVPTQSRADPGATAPIRVENLPALATRIRLHAVHMVGIQGFGYLGQALSAAEIFAALYGGGLMRPGWDRFCLSPAHYAVVHYAAAAEVGLLDPEALKSYGKDGSLLEAISTERTPLLDLTCGSLAQVISGAIGFALASRYAKDDRRVFAFLSDGEMEEGQTWEAAMFAAHHGLERLTVVIDVNNSQVDGPVTSVTTLEPLADKWRAFGWRVVEVDGHDADALVAAMRAISSERKPLAVIARTRILGGLTSIPTTADGHFLKLDPSLKQAIIAELEAQLA